MRHAGSTPAAGARLAALPLGIAVQVELLVGRMSVVIGQCQADQQRVGAQYVLEGIDG